MRLIGTYEDPGYHALADAAMAFFDRRTDLQRSGVAFSSGAPTREAPEPDKISTDISLVWLDRSDPEAHALADVIMRGVSAGLQRYLAERPLFLEVCPERSLFVNPLFNLQRYRPGEGFAAGTATGPPPRRPPSRSAACSPGSFTSTACPMAAPRFTGRTTTWKPRRAHWRSSRPACRTCTAAG
jgi:hypothetical protein